MSVILECFVPGIPKGAGSKNAHPYKKRDGSLGVSVSDSSGELGKAWRASIVGVVGPLMAGKPLATTPIKLTVTFCMPRPQYHYRSNGTLKPLAAAWHTSKPDRTKLLRALEDSLTGVVWKDDTLVCTGPTLKMYSDRPGARIVVEDAPEFEFQGQRLSFGEALA